MSASAIILATGTAPATPAAGKLALYATAGNVPGFVDASGHAIPLVGGRVLLASNPADPTGTTNTTGLHMGLAGAFTPAVSGSVLLMASGIITNNTAAAGDGAKTQLRYGTGSAPANAAALTGTAVGSLVSFLLERSTASDPYPFAIFWAVTGLTLNTAYWLDLSVAAITGGTGQVKNLSLLAIEL